MCRTNRIFMALLAGVMVASIAGGIGVGPRRSNPTTGTESLGSSDPGITNKIRPLGANDPLRPMAEFWSLKDPGTDLQASTNLDRSLAASDVQFLISTIPDPIDTRSSGTGLTRFWMMCRWPLRVRAGTWTGSGFPGGRRESSRTIGTGSTRFHLREVMHRVPRGCIWGHMRWTSNMV